MSRGPTAGGVLLLAIRFGVALIVLMPLVVATQVAYPYAVGKAVYARSLIEVVFVLWVLLALIGASWRPPRSWLLVLLGAGLGVSVLSAVFGVSPDRSFWSSYIRMQGTVELAHWFALAVVLASVFRTSQSLRMLLVFNLGVSLLVSLIAVASHAGWEIPMLGRLPEPNFPRISATLGNASYLGAYLLVNVVLALGFLVRSFIPESAPPDSRASRQKGRREKPAAAHSALPRWVERAFHGLVVLFGLWGISLSGSMAALAGLLAALGTVALLYVFSAQSRRAARIAVSLMAGVGAAAALVIFVAPSIAPSFDSLLLRRLTDIETVQRTLGNRIASWKTGVEGFADRPVLGWGEDNFVVVFGRYATGHGAVMPANDHAHNKLIEEMATKGMLGFAAYVAIWILTFLAILRGTRRVDARERVFGLFAGAALLGQLVQSQTLFSTASSSLQYVLLLAVAVRFEALAWPPKTGLRLPRRVAAVFRHRVAHGCVVLGVAGLSAAGYVANQAIYSGAAALYRAETSGSARFMGELKSAIDAFGPLANVPRIIMFENVTKNWDVLYMRHRAEAARLLRWANVEGERAVESEPENWLVQHALARLYRAVARTNPEYAKRARQHFDRSLEQAPHRDPLAPLDMLGWRQNLGRLRADPDT